jgi:hypothetical protein
MKKVLNLLFLLLFALNSVCVAEIMEDYRIACKNTDGKNLCKAVLTSDKNAEVGGFKIFPDDVFRGTINPPCSIIIYNRRYSTHCGNWQYCQHEHRL